MDIVTSAAVGPAPQKRRAEGKGGRSRGNTSYVRVTGERPPFLPGHDGRQEHQLRQKHYIIEPSDIDLTRRADEAQKRVRS